MDEINNITGPVKKGEIKKVYCFDGEESYYTSLLEKEMENLLLQPHEKDFNLTVLYGKDVEWKAVLNACQRPPMAGSRHLVILKEINEMRGLNDLANHLDKIPDTTVLLITQKNKKLDGRSTLTQAIRKTGVYKSFTPLKDYQVPGWIIKYCRIHQLKISEKNAELLTLNLGNSLQKIANEIEKIKLNLPEGSEINEHIIERYIGISKDFNLFEFSNAIMSKDKSRVYQILNYVIANPKSIALNSFCAIVYTNFSALAKFIYYSRQHPNELKKHFNTYVMKRMQEAAKNYNIFSIRKAIRVLHEYNLKSIGIHHHASDSELYKELIYKLMNV